jgi:ribonuclease-3
VIGLLINESLISEFPTEDEGILTKAKSVLASRVVLGEVAGSLDLGAALRLSANEEESGGRVRESILADGFEAIVGAIYLDGGIEPSRRLIQRHLWKYKDELLADDSHRNYKSQLQERVQSLYKSPPRYRVFSTSGPDHSKDFIVEVLVQGDVAGKGSGRSKKDAEQDAARQALEGFPDEVAEDCDPSGE